METERAIGQDEIDESFNFDDEALVPRSARTPS